MADGTVVLNQRLLAQTLQNVLVFSNIPTDEPGRQSMADGLRTSFAGTIPQTERSNNWQLENVTFIYNDSLPIYSVDVDFTLGPYVGSDAANNLPLQVALLVKTAIVAAPPNRGRTYFGGLTTAAINDSAEFGSTHIQSCVDFLEDLADGISYTGGAGVAYLRIARRDAAGTIIASNPVESITGDANPATQRRRRKGVGI